MKTRRNKRKKTSTWVIVEISMERDYSHIFEHIWELFHEFLASVFL